MVHDDIHIGVGGLQGQGILPFSRRTSTGLIKPQSNRSLVPRRGNTAVPSRPPSAAQHADSALFFGVDETVGVAKVGRVEAGLGHHDRDDQGRVFNGTGFHEARASEALAGRLRLERHGRELHQLEAPRLRRPRPPTC